MRKFLIIVVIVAVLAVLVVARMAIVGNGRQVEEELNVLPVEVMPAVRGDVTSTCELLGTIHASKAAQVFPETMGRITRILVKEGTYVSKGSRLMALLNETIGFEYEEGYIIAPISGNVANIMVDVGSMVSPQMPVAMVYEYSRVKVAFNMAENAIGCVQKNSKIVVKTDAIPGMDFTGTVIEVSPVIDPMTRTIAVKASVPNAKKLLKPGMTALVTLTLGSKSDVLVIPREALLDSYLFVVIDSVTERRDVAVGLIGDQYVEIMSGLSEGEHVVVVGQQRLAGGEKVNPVPRSE
jgi:multidrug efflux pump subunit AcrA (membrane-fusion protein)